MLAVLLNWGTGVFLWILQNFLEQLFYETPPVAVSVRRASTFYKTCDNSSWTLYHFWLQVFCQSTFSNIFILHKIKEINKNCINKTFVKGYWLK